MTATSSTALNDSWLSAAIARIEADFQRSADTHLIALPLPGFAARGIDLYLKHRSTHPTGSHYVDRFTHAERATDWRGNNNIAESMFSQMVRERHPVPRWIVVGAGTGGTSATIGRYVRYQRHATQLCVADPAGSVQEKMGDCAAAQQHIGRLMRPGNLI